MSDHQAAMSSNQEPTISSNQADYQATGLSIADAARRLGVSENAIRQRIKRETITAAKVDGVWQVFVGDHEPDHQPTLRATITPTGRDYQADHEPIEAVYRVTPAEIEQAVERTAVTYAADMRAMFDEVGQLYRAQLAAKDETIAELRRRAEATESRVSALEAQQTESPTQATSAPQTATDAATETPWWAFWRRSS